MNTMSGSRPFLSVLLVAALAFVGCSSGDDSTGGPGTTLTPMVSVGAMTKGSVIVNGVTFEDNAARITGDDTNKVPGDLQSGMTVKVRGRASADDTGTADRIEIENEVRGALTKTGVDTFTVHGQTVLVDGATIFANVANFDALADADNVEVHGQRDTAGVIRATRVEKLGAGAVDDEVRGIVSNLTGNVPGVGSFNIGTLTISTSATTSVTPAGAAIANGSLVEVHLSGNTATRIHAEDADDEFEPAENEEFEVEGFISGFSSHPGSFKVNDQQVQTTSSTRIEGGVNSDLANDIRVEAEGRLSGGILNARKIAFKETVRIESNATTTGSVDMLGKTVKVTSKTEINNLPGGISSIAAGDGLRVRGFVNTDGSITATRVDKQNPITQADRHIIQGLVTSKDTTNKTLTILGFTVSATNASSADDSPDDSNPAFANIDAFLSAVTAGKTIVKARGSVSGPAMTANEIEIE